MFNNPTTTFSSHYKAGIILIAMIYYGIFNAMNGWMGRKS